MVKSAISSSKPITRARTMARSLVLQNGRVSSTSYAMLRASIAAANPPDAVHSVPRNPRDRKAPRFGVTASDSTLRTMFHAFRRNKAAHKVQRLVKQSRNRQESNDCREEYQRGKEGHHKVIRERRRHLQGVIALDVGYRSEPAPI